ncbi:hypothetical protein SSX86_021740 [Deinandra increscens subsp. villosa]|uniref:Peptidase A1 domain-containing protein n=1 Tax=Deinandra increscens subsp. villosa TaxID=3103831 RepID=A0AAP0CNA2_9ASTR
MMNKLIFLLLTLYLTISDSLSKPYSQHDDGFTIDLIHIDPPLSPLFSATHSLTAEYIAKFQIGTPPVQVFAAISTGSDFAWVQCKPCKKCHRQVGVPFFVPASSSTYRAEPCQSKACKSLHDDDSNNISSCDKHNVTTNNINVCRYKYPYENDEFIKGVIGTDTFWFGKTPVRNVLFGCVDDYYGEYREEANAVVGLGGAPSSFINQLKPVIHGKFSYCLTSQASSRTSKMYFGNRATVSGPNVVSTPLIRRNRSATTFYDSPKTFYYVNLIDVVVGNKTNHSSSSSYNDQSLDHNENGNMAVDFSTTDTLLPKKIHDRFYSSLVKAIDGVVGYDDTLAPRSICYKELNLDRVPVVTFKFVGGDVKVPPENMFEYVGKGLSCLTIFGIDDSLGWFGSLFQRNLMVGLDLVKEKVYFKPTNCETI